MSRSVQPDYDKLRNLGHAQGGLVPNSVVIPVKLVNGVFYMEQEVAAHYGEEFMAKINEMKIPDFSIRGVDLVVPDENTPSVKPEWVKP